MLINPYVFAAKGPAVDPYWSSVSSLLPFLAAPNSTRMTDVAVPQWAPSASVSLSTAKSKFGTSSLYFGANYTYIEDTRTQALGTDDFTIEGFVNWAGVTSNFSFLADYRPNSTNGIYPVVYIGTDGKPRFFVNGADQIISATALTANTWAHIALARVAGVTRLFLNGTQVGASYTDTNNYLGTRLRVGGSGYDSNAGVQFGYLDEFRVTKGVGRYSANFTPPAAAFGDDYTTDANFGQVIALLHMEGTNGATVIKDGVLRTWTPSGAAKIASGAGRFFDTGLSLDGAGSFLTAPANPALTLGTGDFTIEFWFYQLAAKDTTLLDTRPPSGNGAYINIGTSSTRQVGTYVQTGAIAVTSAAGAYNLNSWVHVAMVRKSGVQYLYVNGALAGSVADTTNYASSAWVIGRNAWVTNQDWNGYLSEFRVTKGVARYSAAFTPPAAYFPDGLPSDTYFGQVTSLLHMDGTSGSTSILDRKGKTWTVGGTAKLSTSKSKFGATSLLLDGTNSYLTSPASSDWLFGTGDFTIEMWVNQTSPNTTWRELFMINASGGVNVMLYDGKLSLDRELLANDFRAVTPISAGFHHIAVSRVAGVVYGFVDGVLVWSGAWAYNLNQSAVASIGGKSGGTSSFAGYIDELRILKGIGLYTTNFTPRTLPFPDR